MMSADRYGRDLLEKYGTVLVTKIVIILNGRDR